jgi:hypothetical protein
MTTPLAPTSRKVYQFDRMYYYAKDGVVHLIDENDPNPETAHQTILAHRWRERAEAIAREIAIMVYADERIRITKIVNEMVRCADEAEAQGSPTNSKVWEHMAKHNPNRKIQILVPGLNCSADIAEHRRKGAKRIAI